MVRRLGSSPTTPRPRTRAAAGTRIGRPKMKIRRVNYSPDEFLAAILSLTVDEIGLYWVACTLIYSKRGPIDCDSAWLGRVAGCSSRRARSLIDSLLAKGKLSLDNAGRLTNGRAISELKSAESRVKAARVGSESAAKVRRTRAENRPVSRKTNDLDSKTGHRHRSPIKSHESRVNNSSLNQNHTGSARAHRPASEGQPARAPDEARKVGDVARGIVRNRLRRKP
jgi:uncharacterized protein YdaU (DUF1376 family)